MTHAPEPWEIIDCDDQYVQIYWPGGRTPSLRRAEAERIVACVNLLAGIPTEVLEAVSQIEDARTDIASEIMVQHKWLQPRKDNP